MEQSTEARTDQGPRPAEEPAASSYPDWRPVFSLITFGLLLTVTLVIDALTEVPPMPGLALTAAGLMLSLGAADLLDSASRRLTFGVRVGGWTMAVLGFAVQFVS